MRLFMNACINERAVCVGVCVCMYMYVCVCMWVHMEEDRKGDDDAQVDISKRS